MELKLQKQNINAFRFMTRNRISRNSHFRPQLKISLEMASTKLGADMRMPRVQKMVKSEKAIRQRRSMTDAANFHSLHSVTFLVWEALADVSSRIFPNSYSRLPSRDLRPSGRSAPPPPPGQCRVHSPPLSQRTWQWWRKVLSPGP